VGKRRLTGPAPSGSTDSLHGKPVEAESDLHGLDARAAEIRLESFLTRMAATRPGAVVRVITGRGNRSDGPPVLQPLVRELLDGRLARHVARSALEPGGGAYLVQVR